MRKQHIHLMLSMVNWSHKVEKTIEPILLFAYLPLFISSVECCISSFSVKIYRSESETNFFNDTPVDFLGKKNAGTIGWTLSRAKFKICFKSAPNLTYLRFHISCLTEG